MSTLIKNIGILDARQASPEQVQEIGRVCNVGCLVVSRANKAEFFKLNLLNVGKVLELDEGYKLHTGPLMISRAFLEDASQPRKLCVVGPLTIESDVTPELLQAKLEGLCLIGPAIVPQSLYGTFMNVAKEIVGPVASEPDSGLRERGKLIISNDYLNGLDDGTDISVSGSASLDEELDPGLFARKVASLRVDGPVKFNEHQEKMLEKVLVKTDRTRIKIIRLDYHYVPGGTSIDNFTLMTLGNKTVSCHGLLILLEDVTPEVIKERNISFEAGTVYFPRSVMGEMVSRLAPGTKGIPYDPERLEAVNSDQIMTPARLEAMADKSDLIVMGELEFDDTISLDTLAAKIANLDNYGLITASRNLASILQSKLRQNEGGMRISEEEEEESDAGDFDNVIENLATYSL